jgi:hypothetical protein
MKGMLEKIFIVIVIIFSIFILFGLFHVQTELFKKNQSSEFHNYKISVTHNGVPVNIDHTGLVYHNFSYRMDLFNKSSLCSQSFEITNVESPTYTFDSNTSVEGRSLKDYEKKEYVFGIYFSAQPSDMNTFWSGVILPKDIDIVSNYIELPKLSQNFSIALDIPMFNKARSSHWTNISEGIVKIHAELLDDWNKSISLFCLLDRNYDTGDSNISNCPKKLAFMYKNQQCVQNNSYECGIPNHVQYLTDAVRNGRNIECSFPLKDITPKKIYNARIQAYEEINSNLYMRYRSGTFIGSLSTPQV